MVTTVQRVAVLRSVFWRLLRMRVMKTVLVLEHVPGVRLLRLLLRLLSRRPLALRPQERGVNTIVAGWQPMVIVIYVVWHVDGMFNGLQFVIVIIRSRPPMLRLGDGARRYHLAVDGKIGFMVDIGSRCVIPIMVGWLLVAATIMVVMMVMSMMIGKLTPMMIRFQLAGLQFRHGGGFGNPITLVVVLIAIITLGCGSQQQLH